MVMHFSGRIADSFDREFRCLYADSQIIDCFSNPEDEGMPYYPSYPAMLGPGVGVGLGPVLGLDLVSDRYLYDSNSSILLHANIQKADKET